MKSQAGPILYKVLYSQAVFDFHEIDAVVKTYNNGFLAHGPKVKEFEDRVASLFGKKYGIAVNSGSSANLLSLRALSFTSDKKKVITPVCTFSTTISSITINGLEPVFCDVTVGKYVIDEKKVERHLKEGDVLAILVPQLIGGIADMEYLSNLCKKYGAYLIDDSCDTFAPTLKGRTVASYADVTTTSFYGSHIITASGMGGMIMTDDKELRDKIVTLRDWGRIGGDGDDFNERFRARVDNIPYDGKFLYSDEGFNLKMNEVAAAFGLAQLDKLDGFLKIRNDNFKRMCKIFAPFKRFFYMPYLIDGAQTNWLAFPLTIRKNAPFTRYNLLQFLESNEIQTRVLFSGNVLRHPAYRKYITDEIYPNADLVMERGFLLGCHHGMSGNNLDYVRDVIREFMKRYV